MKILQIIPSLRRGGAESLVAELSKEINRRNIRCDILTLFDSSSDSLYNELRNKNIRIYTLNKSKGFQLTTLFKIVRFILRHHYDVVHAHIGAIKYISLATLICCKTDFFATIHSEAKREAGTSLDKYSRKFMFKYKLCIPITLTNESEKSFEDFYGFPAAVIPNGVSSFQGNIARGDRVATFIHPASCQPIKNQELLIEAFKKLTQDFPYAKLIWVGRNNTYKDLFESLKRKFNSNIEFRGEVENVRDLLASADAMCLSSKMEGMPMCVIEALSVGGIPVCTPVGGCNNIITDGYNGFLSDDLSVENYYSTLKKVCELSPTEISKIRQNCISSFAPFTIERCCDKYLEIFSNKTSES